MWLMFFVCALIIVSYFIFSQSSYGKSLEKSTYSHHSSYITYRRAIEVGERIELFGGVGNDPLFLRNPSSHGRNATIIKFVGGQGPQQAIVAKLDIEISGEYVSGYYVVLELTSAEQTWKTPSPVAITLFDFEPKFNVEEEREHGEWVEEAARLIITSRLFKKARDV